MPFTPLHLGPGAVFKLLGGRRLSFLVFGGSQVLMDIEPLIGIVRGSAILHGYTHTLGGAALIGLVAAVAGKVLTHRLLRPFGWHVAPVTWPAAIAGAYAGTLSHVLLDAFMHADMRPFWPVSNANPLLFRIDVSRLDLLCVGLGASAGAVLAARHLRRHRA